MLAVAGLLAGCMAKGPVFTEAPPPGDRRALIYIYRTPSHVLSAHAAGFDANGKRIATLNSGGYTFFYAPPGHYEIKQYWPTNLFTVMDPTFWDSLRIPLEVAAGETRYVRMDSGLGGQVTYSGGMTMHWELAEVSEATGRQQIAQEKFQPPAKDMPSEFRP